MTENSSSAVGRAAIDAYLDSVELALIAADAPRIDRLQVLQDLEAQIADMLAQQPTPLTEESVRSVLDKLEPPSHFAATYGNGKQPIRRRRRRRRAASHACRAPLAPDRSRELRASCISCLLAVFAAATDARGPFDLLMFLVMVSFVFTPIALWMAYRQLRAHPGMPGRDLVLKSSTVYTALALAVLMLFLAAITEGFVLMALGVAAFVYFEYLLIRRIWRHMAEALPPQPALRRHATQTETAPVRQSRRQRRCRPCSTHLPLPPGEGQGEGVFLARASVKLCRSPSLRSPSRHAAMTRW